LTLDRLGYSMPSDAPAFQAPPYHYRNAQAISIKFETDPESALDVLPAPLELIEPAAANLSFYWYPFTTFGPYHEAILRLHAMHEGKPLTYIAQIFVNTEPPMLAGREVWGYPKKLAKIGLERDKDMVVGWLERPQGVRLATAQRTHSTRFVKPGKGQARFRFPIARFWIRSTASRCAGSSRLSTRNMTSYCRAAGSSRGYNFECRL
jgi:acetoacetate decarboxylase